MGNLRFTKNLRLGKCLNIERKIDPNTGEERTIKRELRKLHRGWGKHRIEDEPHEVYCERLGAIVEYQKGKPRRKSH